MPFAHAKLTCPGSEITSGFWHAVVISPCMLATLAGQEAPPLSRSATRAMISTTAVAATPNATLCRRIGPG